MENIRDQQKVGTLYEIRSKIEKVCESTRGSIGASGRSQNVAVCRIRMTSEKPYQSRPVIRETPLSVNRFAGK